MNDCVCWRCGASIADEPLPLARAAQCRACHADLHVCKLCEFYATGIANECREPIAERVVNKERANFCGYMKLRPGAYRAIPEVGSAREALDALFGGGDNPASPTTADAAQNALEDLFKKS